MLSDTRKDPLLKTIMKILGALGLGLAIIILRSQMPDVFQAFENTLLQFFDLANLFLAKGHTLVSNLPVPQ